MMRNTIRTAVGLALTALLVATAQAAVPSTMNVQGRLTDGSGTPLPAGEKAFLFTIYDAAAGGIRLWPVDPGETQFLNSDSDGLWSATVGTIFPIPDSIFADSVCWLEICVSDLINPPETLPRVRLVSVPYAFMSSRVMTVDGASGGNITSKVSIGSGHSNAGTEAFVAGANNTADGDWSTIGGGESNVAGSSFASVGGGSNNSATGQYATVPGGRSNAADGDYSFAAGRRAKAMHSGSFVWADATDQDINSTGPNQFIIRATGGVGIGTVSPIGLLHVASGLPNTGYFTSNYQDPQTTTLRAEYIGAPTDAKAVYGKADLFDYWGVGGEFKGGFIGTQGIVNPTGSNSYYGTRGLVVGGTGNAYGCAGTASGGGVNYAIWGQASGGTENWGGYFIGNVNVTGTLTQGSVASKIDHPLDPTGKYLYHSAVESPDMMNVYNGNVITDASGTAVVALPDYFEALNRDFRYQLTVMGEFAQAIVAEEIANNQFIIRTDKPNVKVSWQVTGIRHDAFADANRNPVEADKPISERGLYKYPAAFGQPASRGLESRRAAGVKEKLDAVANY